MNENPAIPKPVLFPAQRTLFGALSLAALVLTLCTVGMTSTPSWYTGLAFGVGALVTFLVLAGNAVIAMLAQLREEEVEERRELSMAAPVEAVPAAIAAEDEEAMHGALEIPEMSWPIIPTPAEALKAIDSGTNDLEGEEVLSLAAEKLQAEREERVREVIAQIEANFGQPFNITAHLVDPNNRLSPIVVIVELMKKKLRLTFHLDRKMEICAYQHFKNYECEKSLTAALELVRGIMKVERQPIPEFSALGSAPPPQPASAELPRTVQEVNE